MANVLLRMLILQRFGRYSRFADAMGTSRQYMSAKLCGRSPITARDMEKWSQVLGIRKEDYGKFFFGGEA